MKPIVPAVIPTSLQHLEDVLAQCTFSPEIHVDVVDGIFVPSLSWPYTPQGTPTQAQHTTDLFTLEVDLMVQDQLTAADAWAMAGADMLVFHIEMISPEALESFSVSHPNVTIGVSFKNSTPLASLAPYIPFADYVQVMGIEIIGVQGQPFYMPVLDVIKTIKTRFPRLPVSVDGSVNKDTIKMLSDAGADRFICGSAIVSAVHPYKAYHLLRTLIN